MKKKVSIQNKFYFHLSIISKFSDKEVKYDVSKSGGDKKRVMDMTKAFSYGFELKYSIEQALLETIEDYRDVQSN